MNGTEQRKKMEDEMGVEVRGIFPGTNPNVTQEQVDAEVARVLQNLKEGKFEVIAEIGD